MTSLAIDPSNAEQVSSALLSYLRDALRTPALQFADAPTAIGDGWETYIYGFRPAAGALDGRWSGPLVLRIFPRSELGERARTEAAVHEFVAERGIPAPRVVAVEAGGATLGLPFLIMERVDGQTLLERLSANPLAGRKLIPPMARLNAELHRLPVDSCPLPCDAPLVERQLAGFRERIAAFSLEGLEREYEWLEAHKRMVTPEESSLCHGDFHPNNVMSADDGRMSTIDWARAVLGDRHHDLASTIVIMRTAPAPEGTFWTRLLDRFGRGMFLRRYLAAYRKELPIDAERLRYWEALEAFEWLVRVSALTSVGAAGYGIRGDATQRLPASHLDTLRRYFWKRAR